jgi:hypothetical protein
MSLQDELDALRAEFVRSAPPGRAALYDAKVDELRRTFPIEKALKTGDHAPDFTLPNPSGRAVSLSALLRSGPSLTALGPCDNHVDLTAPAFRADQPVPPFGDGHFGAVALSLFGGVGLDLMAAISAPHDEANAGSSRAA